MVNRIAVLLVSSMAALFTGCATGPETVVFVTKTSLGIDVEQTPPSASFAYDRVEGYFGPRFNTGAVPPVVASFTTNGKLLNRLVKQVYATGDAARVLADPKLVPPADPALTGDVKPMFFGTSTTLGLKIGYEAGGSTSTFNLGYKRKELSVIPKTDGTFPSVLATLQSDTEATTISGTKLSVGQLFATGSAATNLAKREEVREVFMSRVDGAFGAYRTEERKQSLDAIVTLSCLSALSDEDLPKVWSNAGSLALFGNDLDMTSLKSLSAAEAREKYTSYLAVLDPDSKEKTKLISLHRQFVCGLAGRNSNN